VPERGLSSYAGKPSTSVGLPVRILISPVL
jgi:hypothetical protein